MDVLFVVIDRRSFWCGGAVVSHSEFCGNFGKRWCLAFAFLVLLVCCFLLVVGRNFYRYLLFHIEFRALVFWEPLLSIPR